MVSTCEQIQLKVRGYKIKGGVMTEVNGRVLPMISHAKLCGMSEVISLQSAEYPRRSYISGAWWVFHLRAPGWGMCFALIGSNSDRDSIYSFNLAKREQDGNIIDTHRAACFSWRSQACFTLIGTKGVVVFQHEASTTQDVRVVGGGI